MNQNRPKVVVIGGGTGIFSVLSGLKDYPVDLSAVVSMADSGGSTGRLREEFGVLPPGDIRMALVALSEPRQTLAQLFTYRFAGQSLNHSFGNLFLVALADIKGGFANGIHEATRILGAKGRVFPVTLDNVHLRAKLENDQVIEGEANIDCPKHDGSLRIEQLYYDKPCRVNPEAAQVIREADLVVIGPGDLFSSIIPNLIVPGIKESLAESKAQKLYFCNLMTKFGETNDFRGEDFVWELEKYLKPNIFDWIIFNNHLPDRERVKKYEKENSKVVEYSIEALKNHQARILEKDLIRSSGYIRHDFDKVAQAVLEVIQSQNNG